MRQQEIGPELRRQLDRFRAGNLLALRGADAAHAQDLVREEMLAVVNRAGVRVGKLGPCFAAAREFSRAARTKEGPAFVKAVELWLRKWTALGLDPTVLEDAVLACLDKYGKPVTVPAPKLKPPRRKRRNLTYEQAIEAGLAPAGANVERQVKEHEQATARSREVATIVRRVLGEHGLPGRDFVRYNAFALQVDRRHRRYGGKSLDRAVADLVDLAEAKDLDRRMLDALSREVLNLPLPDHKPD